MSDTEDRHSSHHNSSSKSRHSHHSSKHSEGHSKKSHDYDKSSSKKRSKRHHDGSGEDAHKSHKHRRKDGGAKRVEGNAMDIVDDDEATEDMWVEKDLGGDGQYPLATNIPTAESLNLTSHASEVTSAKLPSSLATESKPQRDEWMLLPETRPVLHSESSKTTHMLDVDDVLTEGYGDMDTDKRTLGGGVDFFSSLGTERKKKGREDKPDPMNMPVSRMELNTQLREGKSLDQYAKVVPPKPQTPGGPGSSWRMQKLKRTYETAEEEGRSIEEVALERYGSLDAFEEAKEEKRILDERSERRAGRGGRSTGRPPEQGRARDSGYGERYMFNDSVDGDSRPSSRASSFRKPGAHDGGSGPSTPQPGGAGTPSYGPGPPPANKRIDALRGRPDRAASGSVSPALGTPIPSVMTPQIPGRQRALSPSSLNRLQAKVLRAKLMDQPDAEELERQYEMEVQKAQDGGGGRDGDDNGVRVEVLPTLDGHGRLYDVGIGRNDGLPQPLPGNRKKKEHIETRDPKTGEILRYNADDDSTTLGDLLRQERFGAGMADQKDMDMELAGAIMKDGKFENDLEYMDDNAEKLGRKKMRTDAMKRQFAINDYARTQKAMSSCQFCYGDDDSPPKAGVIAMGTRVYLACTLLEELVPGHCYIVPMQHHMSMLEADDDVWDEVKNFMKCLMKMFADQDKGVVFYETVLNLKWQKHTFVECVPVPFEIFHDLPAYFKESIMASEAEWSQHKKLIDFSSRPGGFRRAMVPNLPYFMVQWDYRGEKGYGHVIEGSDGAPDLNGEEGEGAMDDGDKGGGDFPKYFAAEILGNQLDIEPRKWRRPKKMDTRGNKERVTKFKTGYSKYDWTHLIQKL
ncbi:hypothetical protein FRB94_010912 [Tulasnella sp. JGI-2019a]|nr:hypothetical protein FRB94_010912 [Tulasnella sp. JGI-2019a]